MAPHTTRPGIRQWGKTISVASAPERFKNWSATSGCALVRGCHRQRFVPNCSGGDIPGSEGHGAGSLIPPSIGTTTNTGSFRGQGQVSNEGSWDGPVRLLRSLFSDRCQHNSSSQWCGWRNHPDSWQVVKWQLQKVHTSATRWVGSTLQDFS